jgi:hypothetical protein
MNKYKFIQDNSLVTNTSPLIHVRLHLHQENTYVNCNITFHKPSKSLKTQFLGERTKINFEARMIFFTTLPVVDDSVDHGRVS